MTLLCNQPIINDPKVLVIAAWTEDDEISIHVPAEPGFEVLAASTAPAITIKLFGPACWYFRVPDHLLVATPI